MSHLSNPLIMESKTLWIGDIEHWMDEPYIASLFAGTGAVVSVKVIRDKNSGLPAGYGFVEFQNHTVAQEVLQTFNGKMIPGTNKTFRLNWGVFGGGAKPSGGSQSSEAGGSRFSSSHQTQTQQAQTQQAPTQAKQGGGGAPGPEFSIYVGELDSSVNDAVIAEFFSRKYKSVLGAKVIVDPVSKQSKGFGFVKFGNYEESQSAIREMQGSLLRGRAIKTSQAYMKNASSDSTTTNLNQMFNPLAALATSPFMMGMGNLAAFGGQNLQSFPSFPGGAGMSLTPTLSQAYGSYQDPNAQLTAQPSMYGFPSFGGADQGGYQAYQGYAGYQNPYAGYQQQQQQQGYAQNAAVAGAGYMGSFFDPTNAAPVAQSTSPHQQTPYAGTAYAGYQMYGQAQTAQYPQAQGYGTVDYTQQQQQQYMTYGQQQQQQQVQPTVSYGTAQQGYQQPVNNVAAVGNANEVGATVNTVTEQPKVGAEAQQQVNEEVESTKIEEEEDFEPIMLYNSACIENNFRFKKT